MGSCYVEQGKVLEADGAFKKAIEIDYKCVEAHSNLGVVYEKMGLEKCGVGCGCI